MSLLKIARIGHPVLRQVAVPVPDHLRGSAVMHDLVLSMVETMQDSEGVGLAGPQVFRPLRVIVVEVPAASPRSPAVPLQALVNPVIQSHSDETADDWEGCLSIPDLRGLVPRWRSVTVSAVDLDGQPTTVAADGFFARILQHEIDHLDGILFPERMTDLRSLTTVQEFQRHHAARPAEGG